MRWSPVRGPFGASYVVGVLLMATLLSALVRVGQSRDVHVLVPFFKSGYEAAILKVMQESIGVLDRTVGGIDHQLEYVSDRLADLVLQSATGKVKGGAVEGWKALYRETDKLVNDARARVENDDSAALQPDPLLVLPLAQLLVCALARHPDDLADLALRDRDLARREIH